MPMASCSSNRAPVVTSTAAGASTRPTRGSAAAPASNPPATSSGPPNELVTLTSPT